jgi:methylphosphotriester-DNA--protein-cysteine methyltransferase
MMGQHRIRPQADQIVDDDVEANVLVGALDEHLLVDSGSVVPVRHEFESETGRGPMRWLAERRVNHARALLEDTELSVTEVAFASGFGSLQTFRRQFRRLTGTSPRRYRQTFRGAIAGTS